MTQTSHVPGGTNRRLFTLLSALTALAIGTLLADVGWSTLCAVAEFVAHKLSPSLSSESGRTAIHLVAGAVGVLLLGASHQQARQTGQAWSPQLIRCAQLAGNGLALVYPLVLKSVFSDSTIRELTFHMLLLAPALVAIAGALLEADRINEKNGYSGTFFNGFAVFPYVVFMVVPAFCSLVYALVEGRPRVFLFTATLVASPFIAAWVWPSKPPTEPEVKSPAPVQPASPADAPVASQSTTYTAPPLPAIVRDCV